MLPYERGNDTENDRPIYVELTTVEDRQAVLVTTTEAAFGYRMDPAVL